MKKIDINLMILILLDVALGLFQVILPITINYTTLWVPEPVEKSSWYALVITVTATFFYILFIIFRLLYNRALEQNHQSGQPEQNTQTDEQKHNYIPGRPITDPNYFVGRRAEVDRFFNNFFDPQPLCLQVLGLYRGGKTSFLYYVSNSNVVHEKFKKKNDAAEPLMIYIDVEHITTVGHFYVELTKEIKTNFPQHKKPKHILNTNRLFEEWLDLHVLSDYRMIILLDNFEALTEKSAFNAEFFEELRSLFTRHLDDLVCVTSSYINFSRLPKAFDEDEASDKDKKILRFFDLFNPKPVILAGLKLTDADELIRKPTGSDPLSCQETVSIQKLAGFWPFFLQAAAIAWVEARQQGLGPSEAKGKVKQQLLTEMKRDFDKLWNQLKDKERTLLIKMATQTRINSSAYQQPDSVVNDLLRYGLITKEEKNYRVTGEVFAEWIRTKHSSPLDIESA